MELGQLRPQMGYRLVRADLRITPGWTHPGNSGKNGNFRKIRNLHVTYQMKAFGKLVHVDTKKFQNSGNFWENSGKTWKKRITCQKSILLSPEGRPPREY